MADLRTLFNDLTRFETELSNTIDARLRADCDLTLVRFDTMQLIARLDTCRVYDIADELAMTVGGASKVVDRIESAGHCRRRSNPDDRRSSLIQLTASGRRRLAKASIAFDDELERRLNGVLSPRALDQFGGALSKLVVTVDHR